MGLYLPEHTRQHRHGKHKATQHVATCMGDVYDVLHCTHVDNDCLRAQNQQLHCTYSGYPSPLLLHVTKQLQALIWGCDWQLTRLVAQSAPAWGTDTAHSSAKAGRWPHLQPPSQTFAAWQHRQQHTMHVSWTPTDNSGCVPKHFAPVSIPSSAAMATCCGSCLCCCVVVKRRVRNRDAK